MSSNHPPEKSQQPEAIGQPETEKVLCPHCQRTATNKNSCKGICVADSDY